ncbi:MAG: hypothetical protein M3P96_08615 [Actinomycetota bacterium]|nr:hypothetical protein [Actinomycetota bacterium]
MTPALAAAGTTAPAEPQAVDFGQGVEDAWSTIATFVPKLLGFLIILVVGYLVARALLKLTDTVLEWVGFDRAVERGGIKQALARSQYDASDIVAKIVYYAVLLITLTIAFNSFGPNPISDLLRGVIAFLPKLIVAIIIIVIAAAIAKAVKDIVTNVLGGLSYGNFLGNVASVFVLGLGVIAALTQIGIAVVVTSSVLIAVLATIAGILIVGVGGGLVRPMEQRWHEWLDRASQESQNMRQQAQANRGAARDTVAGYADSAQQGYGADQEPSGGYGARRLT